MRQGFEEAIDLGRRRTGGDVSRDLPGHVGGAERAEQGAAAGFGLGRQRQRGDGAQQLDTVVQMAQVAKAVDLRGQECGMILPAFAGIERNGSLPRTGAVIGDAAGKAPVGQRVMDAATMPREMRAGYAGGLVDGEGLALVKRQRDAAKRGAGGTIGAEIGQVLAQPTVSSKAERNRAESSARGACTLPMRSMSPLNLPTVWHGTPACPAAVISASA